MKKKIQKRYGTKKQKRYIQQEERPYINLEGNIIKERDHL